jgi:hypothetical protein
VPAFAPLNDPVAQLVYAEAGHAVRTVLVDGRVVVDNGQPTTADLGEACRRLHDLGRRLGDERKRTFRIARRLEPIWRGMIGEAREVPLTITRVAWPSGRATPSRAVAGTGHGRGARVRRKGSR